MDKMMGVPPSGSGCQPTASAVPASRSGIPNADERLAELLALEENWNSYRGRPVDRQCAERVRAFFPIAAELGLSPWICPLSDGGLQIERAGTDDYSIEFAPNGTATVVFEGLTDTQAETFVRLFAQGIETAKPPRRETGLARKGESPVVAISDDAPKGGRHDQG